MGAKLVEAGPHGAALTVEGRKLFTSVSRGFGMISRTVRELRPERNPRSLRVWCMPGLATRWLAPRLTAIQQEFSGVSIVLRAIDRLPDFRHHEADLMIAFGDPKESGHTGSPLLRPRMFPVASPRWIGSRRIPMPLEDLLHSELIHEESDAQWRSWFGSLGVRVPHFLKGPRLWDANLGLDAAIAGQGIALASRLTAGDEIMAGRLVELCSSGARLGAYFVLVGPDNGDDPLVRRFQKWLRSAMSAFERDTHV
jgi:DNA-binding transcriptional LysR family regulator